jgi:hypothetical protein
MPISKYSYDFLFLSLLKEGPKRVAGFQAPELSGQLDIIITIPYTYLYIL